MASEREFLIATIVAAAGGTIVGKTRIQKTFYLLQRVGLKSGFSFGFHHYGPYSADLSDAIADAAAYRLINERPQSRASDGVPYSVFESGLPVTDERIGELEANTLGKMLGILKRYSATDLEIASTIDWLINVEHIPDWETELLKRKGAKADRARIERSLTLLEELSLPVEYFAE